MFKEEDDDADGAVESSLLLDKETDFLTFLSLSLLSLFVVITQLAHVKQRISSSSSLLLFRL